MGALEKRFGVLFRWVVWGLVCFWDMRKRRKQVGRVGVGWGQAKELANQ